LFLPTELRFQLSLAPSGKEYIYRPRFFTSHSDEDTELPPFMDGEIRFARNKLGTWYRKVVGWAHGAK
jgi:hypothetical protein